VPTLQKTTYQFVFALLAVLMGLRAYLQARRAGTWSWRRFGLLLLGVLVVIALGVPYSMWLARVLGPRHTPLAVVLIIVPIFATVGLLAYFLRPLKPPPPSAPHRALHK
jgi:hypothetical protein